ncbi:unnamed protein product (macronuclear) [Paramecium tetraurelia]|uniref:Uncharacterized protein n=1 Tax=Paramecium tetraurelia TaxID=5888 RepID=A0E2F3_PARTE|nr:uncharacterized protein GSPATT00022642001 [Paramecium tetraurelia]CAK89470.1 unnamed protein product [Paramecium tetraurelia]|eukprot:XP_001456867.1 hypothetical protein (macronuclear) [Paramecium tetraurelia strain d4-2]
MRDQMKNNISEQLLQLGKQQKSILPSHHNTDTKQTQQRMAKKRNSIRSKFERKETDQGDTIRHRQNQYKRLFTERDDNVEKRPKFQAFNNQLIASQQYKKSSLGPLPIKRKQSIQDYIIHNEKAQEIQYNKSNKLDELSFDLENSKSQRSIKNSNIKPNSDYNQKDQEINQNQDNIKKQLANKMYNKIFDKDNSEDENNLTNQYLEEEILRNNQRFTDKQVYHFPQQEFKPIEQSMMIQFEKIKQKEELILQQRDRQQTVLTNTKESKELQAQNIQRALVIKVTSDDSSDEDINGQKLIRGQYLELFKDFEIIKEFKCYYPHNNISQVMLQVLFYNRLQLSKNELYLKHNFMKKKKIKKQDTIMNLLKQTQHLMRKSQQQ